MNRHEINDPFHRDLFDAIHETLSARKDALYEGSAKQGIDDHATVAEKYAAATSYGQALRDVLDLAERIELARLGGRKSETGD